MLEIKNREIAIERERHNILAYEKTIRFHIMTTRFDDKTEEENRRFRIAKNIPNYCIYGCPKMITERMEQDAKIIVLEMNNDKDKIIGIGLIINRLDTREYNIYKDANYNRYCYIGKNRISREDLSEEEELTLKIFDRLCFEGTYHSKRGQGIINFPTKILYRCRKLRNLEQDLVDMFKKRHNYQRSAKI
jgi:hypothetical protein